LTLRIKHLQFGFGVIAALCLALSALAVFSWLAFEVKRGDTIKFDSRVREALHEHASATRTAVMKAFTVAGASVCEFILLGSAVLAFWSLSLRHQAMMLIIAMAGALTLEIGLKHVFHRARPEPYFNVPLPSSYSFPSGHALAAACFYGMLASLVSARVRRRAAKVVIWIVCVAMVALIGVSRIYLGVHYPSDVIAGYMAACV